MRPAAWAKTYNVPLICNEIRRVIVGDRSGVGMNWIHDVRHRPRSRLDRLDHVGLPRWLRRVWKEAASPEGG